MKLTKKKRKGNRNGRIPKEFRSSELWQGWGEDALILSEELGVDMTSESPGLKVEDPDVQTKEEEEVVQYIPRAFGKVADPILIYLNEIKSFPLLTRKGEVAIAKRIESEQREMLKELFNCPSLSALS